MSDFDARRHGPLGVPDDEALAMVRVLTELLATNVAAAPDSPGTRALRWSVWLANEAHMQRVRAEMVGGLL